MEEGLQLFHDGVRELRCQRIDLGGVGRPGLEEDGEDLGGVRVREEGNPRAGEGAAWSVGGGEEVGRVRVGEELGDDSGLGYDVAVVGEGRD